MVKKRVANPSKGELTQRRILDAALDEIVQGGFGALSHRNIAARAGVQLSLTSYYFGTLNNLILEAYRKFVLEELAFVEASRYRLALELESRGAMSAEEITEYLTQYTLTNVTERGRALAIDCKFLFEPDLPLEVKDEVKRFNHKLRDILTDYMHSVGSTNPTLDANLVLAVVRSFDFQHVSDPESMDEDWLRSNLSRLVSALLQH